MEFSEIRQKHLVGDLIKMPSTLPISDFLWGLVEFRAAFSFFSEAEIHSLDSRWHKILSAPVFPAQGLDFPSGFWFLGFFPPELFHSHVWMCGTEGTTCKQNLLFLNPDFFFFKSSRSFIFQHSCFQFVTCSSVFQQN